jgi:hypothetical protein
MEGICDISASHGDKNVDGCFLECCAMKSGTHRLLSRAYFLHHHSVRQLVRYFCNYFGYTGFTLQSTKMTWVD